MGTDQKKLPLKPYHAPSVTAYGSIRDLTLGVPGAKKNDGGGGGRTYS
jgi:hypothetical protein